MACTADEILASPFAVIGSIGVITDIPNVYERLTKEGARQPRSGATLAAAHCAACLSKHS